MSMGFIFTETHNRKGRADGNEFKRQAAKLLSLWESDDTLTRAEIFRLKKMFRQEKKRTVLDGISRSNTLTRLAFFCHGWPTGISLGFKAKDVPELARTIAAACTGNTINIGLYACLTGRGNYAWWKPRKFKSLGDRPCNIQDRAEKIVTKREGFAMLLCSELSKLGVDARITAHLTAGHTTRNPHKVRIYNSQGTTYRIKMRGKIPYHSGSEWVNRLNDENDSFRFDLMNLV